MPTERSYGEACGIARALDTVGERWAMLIIRELMLGPRRFTDLKAVLPASTNILTDRLNELAERGVLRKRHLDASPAANWVYELTPAGKELAPILVQLGQWGLRHGTSAHDPRLTRLSPTSVLIYLQEHIDPDATPPTATVHLRIGAQSWGARSDASGVTVTTGRPQEPTVELETDPFTLDSVLHCTLAFDEAVREGRLTAEGDLAAVRELLAAVEP